MKKILILLFLFTQLVAYAQVVGTPYMQPSSTNGTAVVSAYACVNDFNPPNPFNSIAGGVLKVGTPVSGVTQTIKATVISIGTYNISTTANGVTFSASGTFTTTGEQDIVLTASGTPILKGNNTFTINTLPNCGCVRYSSVTGVYANVNGTLRDFGTHNLGANINLDPFTYAAGSSSEDGSVGILGYLYQWGRQTDLHELRTSLTDIGPKTATDPIAGKFITTSTTTNDWLTPQDISLWGNGSTEEQPKKANDPCPTGFKIPSQSQWAGLYNGIISNPPPTVNPNDATFNSWSWTGNGFMIGPNLYLPAAGRRIYSDAAIAGTGSLGFYWSSRGGQATGSGIYLQISVGTVNASNATAPRANGFSVRCIAE